MGLVATLSVLPGTEIRVVNTQPAYNEVFIEARQEITPREYLRQLSGEDFNLLDRIIWCESGWNPIAQNKTSSAGGLFQFIDSTWDSVASPSWIKYNPYDNIRAGVILFNKAGPDPWLTSKSCWSTKRLL